MHAEWLKEKTFWWTLIVNPFGVENMRVLFLIVNSFSYFNFMLMVNSLWVGNIGEKWFGVLFFFWSAYMKLKMRRILTLNQMLVITAISLFGQWNWEKERKSKRKRQHPANGLNWERFDGFFVFFLVVVFFGTNFSIGVLSFQLYPLSTTATLWNQSLAKNIAKVEKCREHYKRNWYM